jgi:hypothetical protein
MKMIGITKKGYSLRAEISVGNFSIIFYYRSLGELQVRMCFTVATLYAFNFS